MKLTVACAGVFVGAASTRRFCRDIEPQLKRLRTATDRAIVQLIAARVAEEEKQQQPERGGDAPPDKIDLAAAVEQQQKLDARDEDD